VIGRRGEVEVKFWGREEVEKKNGGREDGILVHPGNGLNGLIRNWCIGGY
jgi:hypothetical protein